MTGSDTGSDSIWICTTPFPLTGGYSPEAAAEVGRETSDDKTAPPWKTAESDSEGSGRQNVFEMPHLTDAQDPDELLNRIISDPDIFFGTPIIRGMRVTVQHVMGMLAAGQSAESILEQYEFLEPEDIQACLVFANKMVAEWKILLETITFAARVPDHAVDEDWEY